MGWFDFGLHGVVGDKIDGIKSEGMAKVTQDRWARDTVLHNTSMTITG
jgi:hypothetical protein